MVRKRPVLQKTFQANHALPAKELKALDQDIQTIVSKNPSMPLIVSNPVYDYFCKALQTKYSEFALGVGPGAGRRAVVRNLKKILKYHAAKWMVYEEDP